MKTYHEVLPCQADRLDGALDVDGGLLLRAVGVGEVDLGSRPLGDVLDVAAVAALHEEVVLGSDVQVGGDGDGAGQAAGQVLQQQGGAPLGRRGHGTGQRNRIELSSCCAPVLLFSVSRANGPCRVFSASLVSASRSRHTLAREF